MDKKKFGAYEVIKELGKGSFGTVYSVIDGVSGEERALKAFSLRWVRPHLIERFRREFSLVARMPYRRIVQVYDFGEEGKQYYFTMELIKGTTLEDKKLSTDKIFDVLCDIAEGLAFIHNRGILHLDLKPANIFLTDEGAKIGDFGLSRAAGESEELTSGTVAYIAPEILQGHQPDMRADLYSLGVIALELFSGNNPFAAENISESMNLQLSLPITESYLDEVPDEFHDLLMSLLDKEPQHRPHNAYSVWHAIADILGRPDDPELRARFLPQPTLIARDKIVSHAGQLFPKVKGKHLWSLEGIKGIGYTRMLEELRIAGQLAGYYPLTVSQFNSMESLLMQLLSWDFGAPLRRHLPTLLWAVPGISSHPTLANIGVTKSPEEPSRDEMNAHILALLEEISMLQPLMIMLEDSVSPRVIKSIAQRREIGRILIVSKNAKTTELDVFTSSSELELLTLAQIHIWISSTLGSVDGLNDFVQNLYRNSNGLPRAIDLTMKKLIAEGYLVPGKERWQFSHARKAEIKTMLPEKILNEALRYIAIAPDGLPYFALVSLLGEDNAPVAISELLANGKVTEHEKWNSLVYFLTDTQIAAEILLDDNDELNYFREKVAEILVEMKEQPEFVFSGARLFMDSQDIESALKFGRSVIKQLRSMYKFDLLIEDYNLIEECANSMFDDELWFKAAKRKASTFMEMGSLEESDTVYRTILGKVRQTADLQKEAVVLNDLSIVTISLNRHDEAYSLLREGLELAKQVDDARLKLFALTNIGAVLLDQNDMTEAANIFWQARNIAIEDENFAALVVIEVNLGKILLSQEKFSQSLDRLLNAISIAEREDLVRNRIEGLLELSRLYRKMGNLELSRRTASELKELIHRPVNIVRVNLENLYIDLYAGTLESPQDAISNLLADVKALAPTVYDTVMDDILPFIVLAGIPISDLSNFPSVPRGELSSKMWEVLMAVESGQFDTAIEGSEAILTNIRVPGERTEMWCASSIILSSLHRPEDAVERLYAQLIKAPKDFYVRGIIWEKIAEICSDKAPNPEKGQESLIKAQEFYSKLNNRTKLLELESIADHLRGSRYGGDAGLLLEVAKTFTTTLEWENLASVILERAVEVSGARRAILIISDDNELIPIASQSESGEPVKKEELQFSSTAIRRAIEKRESLLVESIAEDEALASSESILDLKILMVIAVPLICRDELIGVLYADAEVRRAEFSQRTVRLLETLGEFASMALYNAKLYGELLAERDALRAQTVEFFGDEFIGGDSKAIQEIYPKISAVAAQDVTVLLLGETGVGKDVLSRIVHSRSRRADGPFIVLNCAAVPETLLEAELFGYEKGAFTGATRRQPGKFELADNGTLFLDEIGDMSPALQAKLLSALETGRFMRLGGTQTITADVRIIAATNKNLEEEIETGNFREDLYYRISTVRITIPPLRVRNEDIPVLAHHFLTNAAERFTKKITGFAPDVLEALRRYEWPGNVRQLKNAVEEMALFTQGDIIKGELIPDYIKSKKIAELGEDSGVYPEAQTYEEFKEMKKDLGKEFERWTLVKLLERYNNNISKAAREFGVHRTRLHQLVTKYGLRE